MLGIGRTVSPSGIRPAPARPLAIVVVTVVALIAAIYTGSLISRLTSEKNGILFLFVMIDAVLSFIYYRFALLQFVFLALIGEPFPEQGSALQLVGVVVAARRAFDLALGKPLRGSSNMTTLAAAIYIAAQSLSLLGSSDVSATLRGLLTSVQLFVLLILVIDFCSTRGQLAAVVTVTMLAGLFNAVLAIYQSDGAGATRAAGIVGNANELGFSQVTLLALMLPFIGRAASPRRILLLTTCLAAVMYSVALSLSRGAMIAAAGVLLYYVLFCRGRKLVASLAIVVVIAGILILMPERVYDRIGEIPLPGLSHSAPLDSSAEIRRLYIDIGIRMGFDHPWTGVGLKQFDANITRYGNLWLVPANSAHNMYVSVFAETGLPGLVTFAMLLSVAFRTARRRAIADPYSPAGAVARGSELGILAVALAGFFGSFEYVKIPWILFALANVPSEPNAQ